MNTRSLLIPTAWITTLAAAFYIGRQNDDTQSLAQHPGQSADPSSRISTTRNAHPSSHTKRHSHKTPLSLSTNHSSEYAALSPSERVARLSLLQDPIARTRGFLDLIETLTPEQYEEAVGQLRTGSNIRQRMSEYALLLHAWGKTDPLAAITYADENTTSPYARQTILASWAQQSPESAIAWAEDNFQSDNEKANPWLVGVIHGVATTDRTLATQLLETLPYSRERGSALSSILTALEHEDIETKKAWTQTLTDENLRSVAASRIANQIASQNPAEAAAYALNNGALQKSASIIADQWAQTNIQEATAWIESLDQSTLSRAASGLVRRLSQDDPNQASQWLNNYIGQPAYDSAINTFVSTTFKQDPATATQWANNITDENQRQKSTRRSINRWISENPQEVQNWLQQNEIPARTQEHVDNLFRQLNEENNHQTN